MTWDNGSHHFEVEVLPDGRYDWFYLNRDSGERLGEDDCPAAEPLRLPCLFPF